MRVFFLRSNCYVVFAKRTRNVSIFESWITENWHGFLLSAFSSYFQIKNTNSMGNRCRNTVSNGFYMGRLTSKGKEVCCVAE